MAGAEKDEQGEFTKTFTMNLQHAETTVSAWSWFLVAFFGPA